MAVSKDAPTNIIWYKVCRSYFSNKTEVISGESILIFFHLKLIP